jgi:two-component system, OmpR family, copper resistance phosphate regulon response regulator CusR
VHVLVVEDELKVAEAIREGLLAEGHTVEVASCGEDAIARFTAGELDLVILDLGLPGCDGLDALKLLRAAQRDVPVLILSARDSTEARILGLDAGADDYLVKPFEFAELLARIRALARRRRGSEAVHFRVSDLELDVITRTVKRGGQELELTSREFQILECLFRNVGEPVSRRLLAKSVWRGMTRATPLDNVIDVHMTRLRRKIDTHPAKPLIHTVRGVGFVLKEGKS